MLLSLLIETTSVEILSTELKLQHGTITYHFKDGDVPVGNSANQSLIRTKVGVCPQHNTSLAVDLTCRETLRLFAHLKGGILIKQGETVDQAVENEVSRRLKDVNFTSEEDADKLVSTYSGGMKRKVLIAMALLGDPEVVFLDGKPSYQYALPRENVNIYLFSLYACFFIFYFCPILIFLLEPTAGLDPYNRRTIWDMIIAAKKNRSIILTTHFLDEADILSDRIGIIKDGKLLTCGSSLFLKYNFGVGYTLKFETNKSYDVTSIINDSEKISNEADSPIHRWRIKHGAESLIPELLSSLSTFGATKVTIGLTTLEEVFLKTGKEDHEDVNEKENMSDDDSSEEVNDQDKDDDEYDFEEGESKYEYVSKVWNHLATRQQLGAIKKFLVIQNFMMKNAWKGGGSVFLNILMPVGSIDFLFDDLFRKLMWSQISVLCFLYLVDLCCYWICH